MVFLKSYFLITLISFLYLDKTHSHTLLIADIFLNFNHIPTLCKNGQKCVRKNKLTLFIRIKPRSPAADRRIKGYETKETLTTLHLHCQLPKSMLALFTNLLEKLQIPHPFYLLWQGGIHNFYVEERLW